MKKFCLAVSILAASTSAAWAQSSVTIYGILDGAVRYTTNSGTTAATKGSSLSQMVGGGMSQSRLGVNVTEDMGDGLKAIANLEHRLLLDTGTAAAGDFWRQAWVGLQSNSFGRITLGRQYNLLFDAATSTYASFKYSPYIEVFKPEIGMALTARQNNMIKYLVESGGLRIEAQVSAGEASADVGQGKSMGGMARYAVGGFAGAYVWLRSEDAAGKKVTAQTLGGSWTDGPLYVNVAWAQNKFEGSTLLNSFNPTQNVQLLASIGNAFATRSGVPAAATVRDLYAAGVTYQLTPQLNLGAQFWKGKQNGLVSGAATGVIDAMAFVADYALSKRTDAYVEFDNTRAKGNLMLTNGASTRTGYMAGLRHRF